MIEKVVRDYLLEKMDGIPVYLEIPAKPPSKFVFIEKTGSRLSSFINTSTFAVQSNDTSLFKAATLNEMVINALLEIIELDVIISINKTNDYPWPNADRKEYRYQAVFEIKHY